ncbi:MAG TPA: metal-dependent transcriptional regulator [Candidatus Hydrogenedentes bacterium]|nr:metal-dependent transcriptional regulator [Candidatus Hydrogenedentota bacterium]
MSKDINDSAYWREFEKNELTHSAAHYLMAIDSLREELGYARVTDVADKLEVSRGAASMSIAHLKKRGWVKEDPNRFLLLADDGRAMANIVEHNFRILSKFFGEILGLSKDTASADACKMEHLMSLETGRHMIELINFMESDPGTLKRFAKFDSEGDHSCSETDDCPICSREFDIAD